MLRIFIDDIELTQAQLNACIPVLNANYTTKEEFKDNCIKAMSDAGCPLYEPQGKGI